MSGFQVFLVCVLRARVNSMKISVIINTFNQPEWLEKVLWAYALQDDRNFEILIADDGSRRETADLIERCKAELDLPPVQHIWHEDDGFRKTVILNKATVAAQGEYLIYTDGDCSTTGRFCSCSSHLGARPDCYLSGGYFKLSMDTSKIVDREAVTSGDAFRLRWLKRNGLILSVKGLRLGMSKRLRWLLDVFVPTKRTWDGNNSSGYKHDILRVNGYDERMAYGGEDVEMGLRLLHAGVRPIRIRYRALVLHLDHARGYDHPESIAKNRAIREETLDQKKKWTDYGIVRNERL